MSNIESVVCVILWCVFTERDMTCVVSVVSCIGTPLLLLSKFGEAARMNTSTCTVNLFVFVCARSMINIVILFTHYVYITKHCSLPYPHYTEIISTSLHTLIMYFTHSHYHTWLVCNRLKIWGYRNVILLHNINTRQQSTTVGRKGCTNGFARPTTGQVVRQAVQKHIFQPKRIRWERESNRRKIEIESVTPHKSHMMTRRSK